MDRHWYPLAIAALLLTAVAAGCTKSTTTKAAAPSASNPSSTPATGASRSTPPWVVGATLKEFAVTPTVTVARAGTVTFAARNLGKIKHELVVLRTDRQPASLPIAHGQAREAGKIGEIEQFAAGGIQTASFRLAPGRYVLLCNVPGHYQRGMHVGLTVQ
jgi:uncharacterized cupredoxin-like copper-binding protein